MTSDRRWVAVVLVVGLVGLVVALTAGSGYTTATISDGETVTVDVQLENATAMNDDAPGNPGGDGQARGQRTDGGNETSTERTSTNASIVAPPLADTDR